MSSAQSVRLFLALVCPKEWRNPYDELIGRLSGQVDSRNVKFVPFDNAHLTLRFFGSVQRQTVEKVIETVETRIAKSPAFTLHVEDIGAFPNMRKPRVLWIVLNQSTVLQCLYSSITRETAQIGKPPEHREFQPHLTFARIKEPDPISIAAISEFLKSKPDSFTPWEVKSIELMESNLTPNGAIYSNLRAFTLTS
jgi:2'-5' RNA ligase